MQQKAQKFDLQRNLKGGGHVHFHDNFFLSIDSISNTVNDNVI